MADAHASTIDSSRMPIVASEVCSASTAAALPKFRPIIAQNEKTLQPFRSGGLLALSRKADRPGESTDDQKKHRQRRRRPGGFERLVIGQRIEEAEQQRAREKSTTGLQAVPGACGMTAPPGSVRACLSTAGRKRQTTSGPTRAAAAHTNLASALGREQIVPIGVRHKDQSPCQTNRTASIAVTS